MDNELAVAKHFEHQLKGSSDTNSDTVGLEALSLPSSSSSQSSSFRKLRWLPRHLAFSPFPLPTESPDKSRPFHVVVRKPLLSRLTKDIVETYQICNSQFKYLEDLNPKHYLTSPSVGVLNDGNDNANSDLILSVNYTLVNFRQQRSYVVKDVLGQGTFGQVVKCWFAETDSFVAVKIIKNQPAYYQQALVEVSILNTLNNKYDPEDQNHIVRIYDYFVHQHHLCIAFELLDTNLYELIKMNNFRGLSLKIVQLFSKQILFGLAVMKNAGIIHCDLKPENVLLCTRMKPVAVKIIDFGSACMEGRTVYSYIQSRYYRSPEVVLGYHYTTAIDMWSFGCIVAELFLGLPLFPGASEFDLLRRMIKILGGQPPDHILKEAKNTSKYFKCIGSVRFVDNGAVTVDGRSAFQVLTEEEYEARELKKPALGKEYFNYMNLEAIVTNCPYRKNLPEEDIAKECQIRLALIDFLRGLVEFDPAKRWSPSQASKHPFVTGEPFTCPYVPPQETPRMFVSQNVKIDHHPGGGHWFAAGLSACVPGMSSAVCHNSPHLQMTPHAQPNSYGSLGSRSSYTDGPNSYGSCGDSSNMFAHFSPGINHHHASASSSGVFIPASPDSRFRFIQHPRGNGNHGNGNVLGISPSAANLAPSLPLQFTPPNSSYIASSPGHYGPTSPARSSCHGSPLAKIGVSSSTQFNRRKNMGFFPQETSSSPQRQFTNGIDGNSQGFGLKQQRRGCLDCPITTQHVSVPSSTCRSNLQFGQVTSSETSSTVLPDPGDWDPNYSEELLLEEDCSQVSCLAAEFSKGMLKNHDFVSTELLNGVGRYNHSATTNSNTSAQRANGQVVQAFSGVEMMSNPLIFHDPRAVSKPPHFMPHVLQSSMTRLGQQQQQPFQRNHALRSGVHETEWNHMNTHSPPSSFFARGPHSPRYRSAKNDISWGVGGNRPVVAKPASALPGRRV